MIKKDSSNEILFAKYQERGAYHWSQYFGSTFKTDTFLRGRYDLVVSLLTNLRVTKSTKILEIGCGDGALCGLLYKTFGCSISGLDPSPDGIKFSQEKFLQQKFTGTFIVADGYTFPFDPGAFDIVLCCDVIEHLQKPDAMVKEMHRLLMPGGHAIITTPIRTNEIPDDKFHVMEFFPGELSKLCRDNFGEPRQIILSHPVIWFELYTHATKRIRSLVKAYCRIMDKWFGKNVFLGSDKNSDWKNFKMQCVVLSRS
jgi:ubiquinone/menaquinone biosynthesis C-methylase UbiE